jgi:hypothetical protein
MFIGRSQNKPIKGEREASYCKTKQKLPGASTPERQHKNCVGNTTYNKQIKTPKISRDFLKLIV